MPMGAGLWTNRLTPTMLDAGTCRQLTEVDLTEVQLRCWRLAPQIDLSVPFECIAHLLAWASCAQRCVTRSTYASELYAAVDAFDSSPVLA
eukprot:1834378-Amphidinium_carterae.2